MDDEKFVNRIMVILAETFHKFGLKKIAKKVNAEELKVMQKKLDSETKH